MAYDESSGRVTDNVTGPNRWRPWP